MKIPEIALQEAAMAGSGKITLFHKKNKEFFTFFGLTAIMCI